MEFCNRGLSLPRLWAFITGAPGLFLCNWLIVFTSLAPSELFRRRRAVLGTVSLLWLMVGVVQYIVVRDRTTPFSSMDLLLIREALSLLEKILLGPGAVLETAELINREKETALDSAREVLSVWELVLRDALLFQLGQSNFRSRDALALVERIGKRFTIRAVQGMIDKIIQAQTKLVYRPNAAFTLDAAVVGLSEYKEHRK